MTKTELLNQIQKLSRTEKSEIMVFLATELAREEGITNLNDSDVYLAQLRNSHAAANQLMRLLEKEKQVQNS